MLKKTKCFINEKDMYKAFLNNLQNNVKNDYRKFNGCRN